MHYTSNTKADLESYNATVTQGEGYKGVTAKWADITEHPDGNQFAILAHPNYLSDLDSVDKLSSDWFPSLD